MDILPDVFPVNPPWFISQGDSYLQICYVVIIKKWTRSLAVFFVLVGPYFFFS